MSPASSHRPLRLAVYTDYPYHLKDGEVHAERAFALFLARMGTMVERLVVLGRLHPGSENARYPMGEAVELVPLPYYPSLGRPLGAAVAMARSLRALWRGLDEVDCTWLLGPHPLAFVLVAFSMLRGRRAVLGVRQDLPAYVAYRHPGRPLMRLATRAMDRGYRILSRRLATVVVGPDLAARYGAARRLLEIAVTLVSEADIVPVERAMERDYSGELTVLSVGRLDPEKNPLLLAEVLAELRSGDERWRLIVCGEGSMEAELVERLEALGVAEQVELHGYVPHRQLLGIYRRSHALLHVSWTEGVPQVVFEAFAAGTPVVATAVGGIPDRFEGAAALIPPADSGAAVAALREIATDPAGRRRLLAAGNAIVAGQTIDRACERVLDFLEGSGRSG